MSHAYGQLRFSDGLILHFEYNGTSDVCISNLHNTKEGVCNHWRRQEWLKCNCGRDEAVEVANNYGDGSWSPDGRACRHCKAITFDPVQAYMYANENGEIKEFDGLPDWWE